MVCRRAKSVNSPNRFYPNARDEGPGAELDYWEIYGGISGNVGNFVDVGLKAYYTPDFTATDDADGLYVIGDFELPIPMNDMFGLAISGHVGWQDFERDFALEPGVESPIHLTHTALAEQAGDLVVRKRLADQERILSAVVHFFCVVSSTAFRIAICSLKGGTGKGSHAVHRLRPGDGLCLLRRGTEGQALRGLSGANAKGTGGERGAAG